MLDAPRPRLNRSEYIRQVEERGFKLKNIKAVYNILHDYIALEDFSMYPEDHIDRYYLREKSDFAVLFERIYTKLKIIVLTI